jgi:hypothetical protein
MPNVTHLFKLTFEFVGSSVRASCIQQAPSNIKDSKHLTTRLT